MYIVVELYMFYNKTQQYKQKTFSTLYKPREA